MSEKKDVWQGTLALMVLKTLDTLGRSTATGSRGASSRPARFAGRELRHAVSRIAEAGTGGLHPVRMGVSDNNRRAKYYKLTRAGRSNSRAKPVSGRNDVDTRAIPDPGEEPS